MNHVYDQRSKFGPHIDLADHPVLGADRHRERHVRRVVRIVALILFAAISFAAGAFLG